jgi:hypothetical protein
MPMAGSGHAVRFVLSGLFWLACIYVIGGLLEGVAYWLIGGLLVVLAIASNTYFARRGMKAMQRRGLDTG